MVYGSVNSSLAFQSCYFPDALLDEQYHTRLPIRDAGVLATPFVYWNKSWGHLREKEYRALNRIVSELGARVGPISIQKKQRAMSSLTSTSIHGQAVKPSEPLESSDCERSEGRTWFVEPLTRNDPRSLRRRHSAEGTEDAGRAGEDTKRWKW